MADEPVQLKLEVSIQDAAGEKRTFTSIGSLKTVLEKEAAFWSEAAQNSSNNNLIGPIRNAFQSSLNQLNAFSNSYPQWDDNARVIQQQSFTTSIIRNLRAGIFSDTPFANAFLASVKIGLQQSQAFWNYVINRTSSQQSGQPNSMYEGIILGYEFMHQEESVITKRRDTEKHALAAMRKALSEKTDEVIGNATTLQNNLKTKTDAFQNALTEWKEATQTELTNQRTEFFDDAVKKLEHLEKLYTEKLRLEKPAEYWHKQAVKFQGEGNKWGKILVGITLSTGAVFTWLFYEWLASGKVFEKFSAMHWQGIILLAAVLSLTAFLIRTFGKLTFSAFHLQRDAEEREQLAYFYLALTKETQFDEESRKIVFQSLFSRAETGLLSGDHGPTMPGIAEVISRVK